MMRVLLLALPLLLAACGEKAQIKSADTTNRGDTPPWQGAKNEFVAKGWKAGDQAAWEAQMRTRSLTQNEYNKVN
ncbi:hypothetical protein E4K72_01975 [Oxalobacteraceae bacterium OM1]|nr:hypothetical protein E4K72_01975 [Oxalobacteraceae bacterium OM1]